MNPQNIWSYINSKNKTRSGISHLCIDPYDPKSKKTDKEDDRAKILRDFFSSVFTGYTTGRNTKISTRNMKNKMGGNQIQRRKTSQNY